MKVHSPFKLFGLGQKVFHGWLDQNFDPSLLTNKLSWEKRKKIKMADSKKQRNSKLPILNIFCENFMGWSLA